MSGRKRILLIEDNVDIATAMRVLLHVLGHDVQSAHTGARGLQIAAEFRPEVVFLDLGLPVMDGFAVARALRMMPGGDAMVIIAISGWGDERTVAQAKEAGFDRHWLKPLGRAELEGFLGRGQPTVG